MENLDVRDESSALVSAFQSEQRTLHESVHVARPV